MIEAIHKILDRFDGDIDLTAAEIYDKAPRKLALYCVALGLNKLKSKKRATRRRELKREVQPRYRTGRITGSIELTPQTKKKVFKMAEELLGDNGWKIGRISLGNLTKEELIGKAMAEERSATGHLKNAQFYRALAEPMKSGELVCEYWNPMSATAVKEQIWKETEGRRPALI